MKTQTPYHAAIQDVASALEQALESLGMQYDGAKSTIALSKSFGDFSSSIAFALAKSYKKSPADIAAKIKGAMKLPDCVSELTAENAYLNFHLDREKYVLDVVKQLLSGSALSSLGEGSKILVESPSVNPNKPWHVGHLRNAILGDVVSRLHEACGYEVEREDYIDDLGLQVAESLWGFLHLSDKPDGKFDYWLGQQYVKVSKEIEKPDIKAQVTELLTLMEQDGTDEAKVARDLARRCVDAQYETSFNYGISTDFQIWESDIVREELLSKSLQMLERFKILEKPKDGKYAGCVVLNLKSMKDLPPALAGLREDVRVLIRSDGTPTYLAKDIAHHMWKLGILANTFKYSKYMEERPDGKPIYMTSPNGDSMQFGNAGTAINIVGVEQDLPQMILAYAFHAIGEKSSADRIQHMSYGRVEVEGGLSGRKGTWLEGYTADHLLDEAKAKARAAMGDKFKLSEQESESIARSVAVASIKFEYLRVSPEKQIQFSWDRAMSFEGASGPYCQYMHARAVRMLDDGKFNSSDVPANFSNATGDAEFALVKQMSLLGEMAEKACRELRPNVMVEYVTELAYSFSRFYEQVPVLKAQEEHQRKARLALTLAYSNALARGLGLLGIEAPQRM